MQYLVPGYETYEHVELLFQFGHVKTDEMKNALKLHFVDGVPQQYAAARNHISASSLNHAVKKLNDVEEIIIHVKEHVLAKQNKSSEK